MNGKGCIACGEVPGCDTWEGRCCRIFLNYKIAKMAESNKQTLRLLIQKESFAQAEERLIGIATVTKPGRKKKQSYLCVSGEVTAFWLDRLQYFYWVVHVLLVVNSERPPKVIISRVKQDEVKRDRQNERPTFRKVKTWSLADLRIVDGRSAENEVAEFDLHFDKGIFKWTASSVAEKKAFVVCLYKVVYKYLDRKRPEFINVDESRLRELIHTSAVGGQSRTPGAETEEEGVAQGEFLKLVDTLVVDKYTNRFHRGIPGADGQGTGGSGTVVERRGKQERQ